MKTPECEYENNGTVITAPGKFEGEPVFAPWFWDAGLSGMSDDDDGEYYGFTLDESDVARFPQLAGKTRVALREDSAGFVHTYVYP